MKFNFRKVASVLASAVLIGSSAGMALAATYPAPFVVSGVGNAAIVTGSATGANDAAAATSIQSNLNGKLTGTTVTLGEDKVQLWRASTKITLAAANNDILNVYTTSITKTELSTLLADGTLRTGSGDYGYTQKITFGSELNLSHFKDSEYNDNEPTIGFKLTDSTNANHIYNYTLDFTTDPSLDNTLVTRTVNMLGKNYYITTIGTTPYINLLDSANKATVKEGETATATSGGKAYAVSIDWIDATYVKFKVNDEITDKLVAGDTFRLADGTYVGAKSIDYNGKDTGISSAEFTLGSGKIEIINGQNVKLNSKAVSQLTGYVANSSGKLDKIVISWDLDDKAFITPTKELTMPALASIKLVMAKWNVPEGKTDEIEVGPDGSNNIKISAPFKDGTKSVTILKGDELGNWSIAGKDTTNLLATTNDSGSGYRTLVYNMSKDNGFIASWNSTREAESYYLYLANTNSRDSYNKTDIINRITGQTICADLKTADTCSVGGSNIIITMNNITVKGSEKLINMTLNTGGSFNDLYTKNGLRIVLPFSNMSALNADKGSLNASLTSFILWIAEPDKDGNLGANWFNMTLSFTGTDFKTTVSKVDVGHPATESGMEIGDTNNNEYYMLTDVGTKVVHYTGGTQDYAKMTFPGGISYAETYLTSLSGSESSTTSISIIKDTDAVANSEKNLIVVGGSCVNTLAAKILGVTYPACGDASTIAQDKYLIKVVAASTVVDGAPASNVAVLVAGWETADTSKAATKLLEGVATDVGTKIDGPAVGA